MSLAIPFHPKGQPPKAQCPRCVENGNSEVKSFYPIRGLQDGEFDEQIPKDWLRCPPIKLDGGIPGMEALRFQYMNMSRYAIRVTKHWKPSAAKQRAMEAAYGKERKQRRQMQNEVLDLKSKIEELEECEARLAKWESRKPVINHYLGIVGDMAKEIKTLRDQLSELGYGAVGKDFTFDMASWVGDRAPRIHDNAGYQGHQADSVHSKHVMTGEQEQTLSARKRKLSELADGHDYHDPPLSRTTQRTSSRDLMPPPLPNSWVKVKNLIQPKTSFMETNLHLGEYKTAMSIILRLDCRQLHLQLIAYRLQCQKPFALSHRTRACDSAKILALGLLIMARHIQMIISSLILGAESLSASLLRRS
ncbi:hypothetical protein KC315_g2206 [Hortaea werneckii]|nr:hypothetical protein KC315_g2206 [Hortaea werneckii]